MNHCNLMTAVQNFHIERVYINSHLERAQISLPNPEMTTYIICLGAINSLHEIRPKEKSNT